MAKKVTVGVVGTGDIGRLHATAYMSIPGVELVIAEGRNPFKARELAEELGVTTSRSFDELLNDDRVDAVDLCVPNHLHHSYAMKAAAASKPTLLEKPLALTERDGEEILQAFERAEVPLMVGHTLRFWPEYAQGRQLMKSGKLGPVRTFSARRMLSLLMAVTGAEGWRRSGEQSGGAVIDLQIHDIDYVLWTFGKPRSVYSEGVRSEYGSWDHVFTILEYDDGLKVTVESSFMLKGNPVIMDFRAVADDASLEFSFVETDFSMHDMQMDAPDQPKGTRPSLVVYRWGQPTEIVMEQPEDPLTVTFQNEMKAFVRLISGETPPEVPSPEEALLALKVVLASKQSCETGRPVRL